LLERLEQVGLYRVGEMRASMARCNETSENLPQVFAGYLAVAQDLSEQAAPNGLATMDGNDRASPVGVAQKMMAPLGADDFEAQPPQRFDELRAADGRERAHAGTVTR
jgi:hypothetical protein